MRAQEIVTRITRTLDGLKAYFSIDKPDEWKEDNVEAD